MRNVVLILALGGLTMGCIPAQTGPVPRGEVRQGDGVLELIGAQGRCIWQTRSGQLYRAACPA